MMRSWSAAAREEKSAMSQNNIGRDTPRGDPATVFDAAERWRDALRLRALRPFAGAFDYTSGNNHKNARPMLP